MIEIKVSRTSDNDEEYELVADGVSVFETNVLLRRADGEMFAWLKNYEDYEILSKYAFSDLPEEIEDIVILSVECDDFLELTRFRRIDAGQAYQIIFTVRSRYDDWGQGYSFKKYFEEFEQISKERPGLGIIVEPEEIYEDGYSVGNGFFLKIKTTSTQSSIENEVARCEEAAQSLKQQVEASLDAKAFTNAAVTYFSFPKEVEIACEQYLLYFVEFLRDLGVEATANLQHEAGQVLFAVTPMNKEDALDKIRTAFDVYLHLPSSPINDFSGAGEDGIAIQRLSANIHHLKGQLILAQAVLQAKDTTIQAQQFTIEYQQRLLSGEIIIDSLKKTDHQEKSEDKENLLGGTLAITKYQGKGFEINLPDLYRRLRNFLGKGNGE